MPDENEEFDESLTDEELSEIQLQADVDARRKEISQDLDMNS